MGAETENIVVLDPRDAKSRMVNSLKLRKGAQGVSIDSQSHEITFRMLRTLTMGEKSQGGAHEED